jgi:uncharacterized protein (DUF934 family)
MPRRLLRDRQVVADDWRYAEEFRVAAHTGAAHTGAAHTDAVHTDAVHTGAGHTGADGSAVILGLDRWRSERDAWIASGVRLGVVLLPEHKAEQLAPDLSHLSLVACSFSGPAEGRGYTQGRLLRERYDFSGELRAVGYVHVDQLFFLARCGFNSFELTERDLEGAAAAFTTFTAAYQPANDRGLAAKLEIPRY